jgi:ribose 1,5-bisphosphate isomerase
MGILKEVHKTQKFIVHNTETRPFFQGRLTAKELSKVGIKVVHYVDSAARLAIKNSDIMLIGSDAITSDGYVINKVGTEMMADIAQNYSIPVYVCTSAWKFDGKTIFGFQEEIEKRFTNEVWAKPPKNVEISNYVFEKIHPNKITGIISELGIFTVDTFISRVIQIYPWIV